MLQFVLFILIYTFIVFIWSFVYINKNNSNKKTNIAFLYFISLILLWMFFDISNVYSLNSTINIIIKSLYFITMLNLSVFFLNFIYRLVNRKYDFLFYLMVSINTLTIGVRYLFPMDFTSDNFWQLSDPVVAPLMATAFSLSMIWAVYIILKYYFTSKDFDLKRQIKIIIIGIVLATLISILSEYVLPTLLKIDTNVSFMYLSFLVLVIALYYAIIKHKFLNIQIEYLYNKLFLNSSEGMLLINSKMDILSINDAAKAVLKDSNIKTPTKINSYISEYDFSINYNQYETKMETTGVTYFLVISQSPIDTKESGDAKLLHIADITQKTENSMVEKDELTMKSTIDQLTGLFNRRYISTQYSSHIENQEFVLLFIDIDDFKSVNDNYGHLIGDEVLKKVASCILSSIRSDEKAIRYGGDEFIVILENTLLKNAYTVAERIRNSVRKIDVLQRNVKDQVTISIGISTGEGNIYESIEKADKAMYYSKENGKNQSNIFK